MQYSGGAAPPPGPPGPSALRSWASPAFAADPIEALLSSPNIAACDMLLFVLEHVFGWGDVAHSRTERNQALGFVTRWLGRDPPGEDARLPSLARLCAQRIAMDIFPAFCDGMNRLWSQQPGTLSQLSTANMEAFVEALKRDIASLLTEKGAPPHLQATVAEEIFVFAIVSFLCVDIRGMGESIPLMNEMHLPIGTEDDDEYDEEGEERLDIIMASIPNFGRGALAKVGILTHVVFQAYTKVVFPSSYCAGFYHAHVVRNLFDEGEKALLVKHPFARSVALAPISSLLHAMVVNDEDPVFYDDFLTKTFLPWDVQANIDDLPPFSIDASTIDACIDAFNADDILYDSGYGDKDGGGVKRFRLNGNYSKEEILHAAIMSKTATFVDVEHCWNLDEECLGLALHHLKDVKVMLLKGTPITETSEVIKMANVGRKQRIEFVFSDACKCCGERNGTIKELQLSRPRKVQRTS